jgi:hypothetical protein
MEVSFLRNQMLPLFDGSKSHMDAAITLSYPIESNVQLVRLEHFDTNNNGDQ